MDATHVVFDALCSVYGEALLQCFDEPVVHCFTYKSIKDINMKIVEGMLKTNVVYVKMPISSIFNDRLRGVYDTKAPDEIIVIVFVTKLKSWVPKKIKRGALSVMPHAEVVFMDVNAIMGCAICGGQTNMRCALL